MGLHPIDTDLTGKQPKSCRQIADTERVGMLYLYITNAGQPEHDNTIVNIDRIRVFVA